MNVRKLKLKDTSAPWGPRETAQRLRHDAMILLREPPAHMRGAKFNITWWGHHTAATPKHRPQEKNYCGTVVCGLGAIAASKASGIRDQWRYTPREQSASGKPLWEMEPVVQIAGRRYESFEAAVFYYGITQVEAEGLFYPKRYPRTGVKKHHVAERMNALAETYEMLAPVSFESFKTMQFEEIVSGKRKRPQ